jgi:hypothetical protein
MMDNDCWRLEARVISIGNDCDWSFAKPPQMKRMRICTAGSCAFEDGKKFVDKILGFLVLYDFTMFLFHVQIHICTEKSPVNTWPELTSSN